MGDKSAAIHAVGSRVWVQDKQDAWVKGAVTALDGDSVTVRLENGEQRKIVAVDCPRQNTEGRPEEVREFACRFVRRIAC